MSCNSSPKLNFSQFTKKTNFKESQIKNFFLYFRKFCKSSIDKLNFEEFKNSLGILGVSNEFIAMRLFDLLCDTKSQQLLTFDSYLNFMNLVNYGTIEEKITHSFKFFDLEKKGYISKENFRKVIMNLCEYFSHVSATQTKVRESDIDLVFEEILEKSEVTKLDLNSFINVSQSHPEILDFFDIFNNKILENLTLTIHKDTLKKIENVIKNLKNLIDKTEKRNMRNNLDVTLGLKSFIERSIRNKKKYEDSLKNVNNFSFNPDQFTNKRNSTNTVEVVNYFLKEQNTFSNNNLNTGHNILTFNTGEINFDINSTQQAQLTKNKLFNVSEKIKNRFTEGDNSFDDNELALSDFTDDEENEELKDAVYELNQVGKTTVEITGKKKKNSLNPNELESVEITGKINEYTVEDNENNYLNETKTFLNKLNNVENGSKKSNPSNNSNDSIHSESEDDFDFMQPADISHLKDKELLDEIVKNGISVNNCLIITNKKSFIKSLNEIKDSLKSIIEEIDPSRKVVKRRQGISINLSKNIQPIDKDDFLNSPFPHAEETGLIHFGNENVELVLNMMIGIRNSVNSLGNNKNYFKFTENDEAFKEINRFKFTQNTYEKEIQIRFYDLAPKVFFNIRKLYGIKNEDYLKSLGPENFLGNLILIKNRSLRELCSTGKSGSFFYFSYDSKFVLKTISAGEFNYFAEILQDYYNHFNRNPNSLLQRFFGLHTMIFNDIKMHFVIMNNVFCTNIQVHYKYDLKGSTFQRQSRKRKENNYDDYDFNIPLKDLDFVDRNEKIQLLKQEKDLIMKELKSDADFLMSKNINDYSLLIGVHNPDMYNGKSNNKQNLIEQLGNAVENKNNSVIIGRDNNFNINSNDEEVRKPFNEIHRGGILSIDGKKVYFFGIIDIFTQYGAKKKFEHFFKSIGQGSGISCKPPQEYAQRFKNFSQLILESD